MSIDEKRTCILFIRGESTNRYATITIFFYSFTVIFYQEGIEKDFPTYFLSKKYFKGRNFHEQKLSRFRGF